MSHRAAKLYRRHFRELREVCFLRCETPLDGEQLYSRLAPQVEEMEPRVRQALISKMRRAVNQMLASAGTPSESAIPSSPS